MFNGISVLVCGPGVLGDIVVVFFALDLTRDPSPDLFFFLWIWRVIVSAVFSAVMAMFQPSRRV